MGTGCVLLPQHHRSTGTWPADGDVQSKTRRGKKQRGGSRHCTLHVPLPLVSLKQPRPRVLACLRSQLLAAFSPASPLVLCCRFYCTALALRGQPPAWIGAGGCPSDAWHSDGHRLGATITLRCHKHAPPKTAKSSPGLLLKIQRLPSTPLPKRITRRTRSPGPIARKSGQPPRLHPESGPAPPPSQTPRPLMFS